jgi:hypothetical protein
VVAERLRRDESRSVVRERKAATGERTEALQDAEYRVGSTTVVVTGPVDDEPAFHEASFGVLGPLEYDQVAWTPPVIAAHRYERTKVRARPDRTLVGREPLQRSLHIKINKISMIYFSENADSCCIRGTPSVPCIGDERYKAAAE